MKFWRAFLIVPFAILFVPGVVQSSGVFMEIALFTNDGGTFPGEFASGKFGVLRPSYSHADLLMAYRMLSGIRVDPGETPQPVWDQALPDRVKPWLDARNKVPGTTPLTDLNADKKVPDGDFEVYPNCLGPAFETAAATLRKRNATWGTSSPQLAEWMRGQDIVFQNCSAGPVIPPRILTAGTLLAADREYQIAAAEFYGGQYDKAETDFDRIALDPSSPWHDLASYVAARACIRQATMGGKEEKLREAATRLRAIAENPARGTLRTSARDLLNFVRARTEPEERLVELGDQLMQPRLGDELQRVLADYTDIWYHRQTAGHPPSSGKSDVTDWILTLQNGGHPVAKWRNTHTLPWLLAALMWDDSENSGATDVQDLIAAAHAVKRDSPAYATATYYGILRQIRAGQPNAARQWADEALARVEPPRVTNLFRAERFNLARNWTEFLQFAPRTPVASDDGMGGTDWPLSPTDKRSRPAFDDDVPETLNTVVPLRLWVEATGSSLIPRNLQAQIAQAGWVRAVILRDQMSARLFAQRIVQLKPELSAEMGGYLGERDPAAANFLAVFLMLRAPGLEPRLRAGWGRPAAVLKRAMRSDNWWNLTPRPVNVNKDMLGNQTLAELYPDRKFVPSGFLPADQRDAGIKEWAQIVQQGGDSVEYLCSAAIAWAKAHPQDPRVPQALYLAVQTTRYGPDFSKPAGNWSKQAFNLLHRRYQNSDWTAKTKYWY